MVQASVQYNPGLKKKHQKIEIFNTKRKLLQF